MTRTLDRIPPYVFYELDRRRAAARAAGRTLLDVGIGSPDGAIPSVVVEAMQRVAADRGLSGYPAFQAAPAYREAVTDYLASRFGVSIDGRQQMLAVAGSKEGIAELILSHVGPGDAVLVPAVHYPVYARATLLSGADPVYVPFLADGRLDLEAIDPAALHRARILLVNYPSNPTTTSVSLEELARYVAFAEQHDLLLISDLAYSELSFDGFRVPSVLQLSGAARVAVETHSCSKSFNMAGVRIGFVAGNADAMARLDAYRSNIGYGVSTFAQVAGTAAFTHHAEIVAPIVDEYRMRRDAIVGAFHAHGWPVASPRATMYLWLDVPSGVEDWAWVDALIDHAGVVVTPGIAFGEAGRGKFRVSFVQPGPELQRAAAGIAATARYLAT